MIGEKDYRKIRGMFGIGTKRLIRLQVLRVVPVRSGLLIKAWKLIAKHHIYVADALQIVSAKHIGANRLVTGGKKTLQCLHARGA